MSNKVNNIPQHKTIPATPATPDTGFGKIYIKSDGSWYGLDDQGVETLLSGGGSGTGVSGSGTLNYLTKWTPDGTTLGNSQIQDDGDLVGLVNAPNSLGKISAISSDKDTVFWLQNTKNGGANTSLFALTNGTGSVTNIGVSGKASGGTTSNYGVSGLAISAGLINYGISGQATGGTTNIGVRAYVEDGANNYVAWLQKAPEGVQSSLGKFLKSVTEDGKANWTSITAADVSGVQGALTLTTTGSSGAATLVGNTLNIPQYSGGGGGGGVSGSGTVNRLTKWTPNSTTLGTSGIAENSTGQLAIDFPTSTNVKLFIRSFTEHDGLTVHTTASDQGSRAIYGSSTGISSSSTNHGVWGDASRNTNNNVGVFGMAAADTGSAPLGIGGEFKASAGSQSVPCAPGAIAIGISAYAYTNGGSAYFARFIKDVAISPNFKDRVVLSDNNYGYADWGKVTSSYTTGESGTFTSADGKTITVTNGLITSIV